MTMRLTPKSMDKFRTEPPAHFTFNQKSCAGCRLRRSLRQFAANSDLCKKCVLRGVPAK